MKKSHKKWQTSEKKSLVKKYTKSKKSHKSVQKRYKLVKNRYKKRGTSVTVIQNGEERWQTIAKKVQTWEKKSQKVIN